MLEEWYHQPLLNEKETDSLFFGAISMTEMPPRIDTVMGDENSNFGILLQHGYVGSNLEMIFLANNLAKKGYRVCIPLLPGHGLDYMALHESSHKDWISKVDLALQLLSSEKKNRKIIIIGHSMGGSLGLYHTARKIYNIVGLVTIQTPVRLPLGTHFLVKLIIKIFPNWKIKYKDFIFNDKRLYKNPYVGELKKNYGRATFQTLDQVLKMIHLADKSVEQIHVPTLIIHSIKDRTVFKSNAKRINKKLKIKNKKLLWLKNSYHISLVDLDKDIIIENICSFCKDHFN